MVAYHGCTVDTARRLSIEKEPFRKSERAYEWLGRGIYFWEYGPDRALRWGEEQIRRRKHSDTAAVVGARIQLGRCFDLLDTRYTRDLSSAYPVWLAAHAEKGVPVPENRGKLKYLDCAVINWYLDGLEDMGTEHEFDTVRCSFREGDPVYPGADIYHETHIQIAVRNPACIREVFGPRINP